MPPGRDIDEYYPVYDYSDSPVMNNSISPEPGVIPAPVQDESSIPLSDKSFHDPDLHDHDIIDSLVYIYYGSGKEKDLIDAGIKILLISNYISSVAVLCGFYVSLKRVCNKVNVVSTYTIIHVTMGSTFIDSLYYFGIKELWRVTWSHILSLMFHSLYTYTISALVLSTGYQYLFLARRRFIKRFLNFAPATVALCCFTAAQIMYPSPKKLQCELSALPETALPFLVPVTLFTIINTVFAVMGLKIVRESEAHRPIPDSAVIVKSLYASAMIVPVCACSWFFGVTAMKHRSSVILLLIHGTLHIIMNYFTCVVYAFIFPKCMDVIPEYMLVAPKRREVMLECVNIMQEHMDVIPEHRDVIGENVIPNHLDVMAKSINEPEQDNSEDESELLVTLISQEPHSKQYRRVVKLSPELTADTTNNEESNELTQIQLHSISTISAPMP